ncbi:MAG: SHOCT domain-containing protein [Eggerthellaceae bacterium]|nr:SHOCT domain-containing protein [Eggerthellaceae bacterium]
MTVMGYSVGYGSVVFVLILSLLLAVIPARIAKGKGYSFGGFYVFGFFFFIIALIVALVMKDKNESKPDQLLQYKKLLDEGVITQEEFDKKKSELL